MKKTLLALALLASAATAFANDGTKPGKPAAKRADHCTGATAAKCDKDMMTAGTKLADMPACCRAKMAAAKATTPAMAEAKPVVKAL